MIKLKAVLTRIPDEVYRILYDEKGMASMSAHVGNLLMAYAIGVSEQPPKGGANV